MRTLSLVLAALLIVMGIVSGKQWGELRSARQQVKDLQGQLAQSKVSVARSAQVQLPPPPVAPPPAPAPTEAVAPPPELPQFRPAVPRAPPTPQPAVRATASRPLVGDTVDERRNDALAQSDRAATARVRAWGNALKLNPAQLEALGSLTTAELRRETEDSLLVDISNGTTDARTAARVKIDTVNRQYDTLVRIQEKIAPQLTPEQSKQLKTMFDGWLTANMARARAEQELVNGRPLN